MAIYTDVSMSMGTRGLLFHAKSLWNFAILFNHPHLKLLLCVYLVAGAASEYHK